MVVYWPCGGPITCWILAVLNTQTAESDAELHSIHTQGVESLGRHRVSTQLCYSLREHNVHAGSPLAHGICPPHCLCMVAVSLPYHASLCHMPALLTHIAYWFVMHPCHMCCALIHDSPDHHIRALRLGVVYHVIPGPRMPFLLQYMTCAGRCTSAGSYSVDQSGHLCYHQTCVYPFQLLPTVLVDGQQSV